MRHQAVRLLSMALLAATALASAQDVTLKIGDPAPPLAVAKWVKGTPVAKFGDGKIHVLEFWATWCGPCKKSIPHLTELAKKYEGKISFTGVSVSESRGGPWAEDTFDKVAKFVADYGTKMEYNVAADGPEATMSKTWMRAAGQNGIPTAFVIGKDGKVAWIGHPMFGMDEVLAEVVAGTFDPKKAAEKMAQEQAEARKQAEKFKPIQDAMRANEPQRVVAELDKLFASDPRIENGYGGLRFISLLKYDEPAAYAYARKLLGGLYKDNAGQLNSIAWSIVDDKATLKNPDYPLAAALAQRACELTKNEDPTILDTLALAYFKGKRTKKAIEIQSKAVSLAEKAGADFDAATLKEMRERLEAFKKA